jgi:glutamate-1-semialdehyde 2,1-aminomutase
MFSVFFRDGAVCDFADAAQQDTAAYAAFFHAMLARGVALAPGAYEILFPGLAHDDGVIDRVVDVANEAAAAVARDRPTS